MQSISVTQLAQWQQQPQAFLLLDVRREQALAVSGVQIEGALSAWQNRGLPVVTVAPQGDNHAMDYP